MALLPTGLGTVRLYNSARAVFYAPSDLLGIGGMHQEHIRATRSWHRGAARYDCVFVGNSESESDEAGFRGLNVARVHCFFSVEFQGAIFPCALVHWFLHVGNEPDPVSGIWHVRPEFDRDNCPVLAVISLDSIFRAAHLIGCSGSTWISHQAFDHTKPLDCFKTFYVNKYADHHAHEIAF